MDCNPVKRKMEEPAAVASAPAWGAPRWLAAQPTMEKKLPEKVPMAMLKALPSTATVKIAVRICRNLQCLENGVREDLGGQVPTERIPEI
jgi:hypothetical protein